ncbi:MAG: DUF58 domain-containing protein [Deinococcus sp.]|nr:DUF58 domain-containing protein [Deinococcus sp.]
MRFASDFLQKLERLTLVVRRPSGRVGERTSKAAGLSTEFRDFRPYHTGDSLRYVDWRAYARLGRLFTKLFTAERNTHIHLLLDASASMAVGDKLLYAARLAAALAYLSTQAGPVHPRLLGGAAWAPVALKAALPQLWEQLSALAPQGKLAVSQSLISFAQEIRSALVILLSDCLDPQGLEAGLRALAVAGAEVLIVQVLSPWDLEPPPGAFELEDAETGQKLSIDEEAVAAYRRRLRRYCEALRQACHARGFHYLQISTQRPVEQVVLIDLRQEGLVA